MHVNFDSRDMELVLMSAQDIVIVMRDTLADLTLASHDQKQLLVNACNYFAEIASKSELPTKAHWFKVYAKDFENTATDED